MKRGILLLATFTLSSALYAQNNLTPQQAREVFAAYNPALLEKASQDENLNQLIDDLLHHVSQNSADSLENRYTLIALARNFENSLALNNALSQYTQALEYAQQGGNMQSAARQHAANQLNTIYPRIWAVSVQTKENLLQAYKQRQRQAQTDTEKNQLNAAIQALRADLKNLQTNVGPQIYLLTQAALAQAEQQALAEQAALQTQAHKALQASNLEIKTKHKKPVAG